MKKWTDQIVVKVTADLPNGKTIDESKQFISVKNSFNVINVREYTTISGFGSGEWNVGHSSSPPGYTWTLELPVTSPHVELFRAFQISRTAFNLESAASDVLDTTVPNTDTVYKPKLEKWLDCFVISCSKSITENHGDVPNFVIDGIAFGHDYEILAIVNGELTLKSMFYPNALGNGFLEAGGSDHKKSTTFSKLIGTEDVVW